MENLVENQSENGQKTVKSPTITGYQSRKYDQTIRPFKNLPLNRNLLALKDRMNYAEFFCMIQLWDWFQSTEIKNNDFKFMLSRSKLAEVTGVSESVAQSTLAKLKRFKAILAVTTSFGVSEYVWSTGFLFRGVYEKQTAPVCNPYGRCIEFKRPLYENHTASIICTLILPFYLPSYTSFSGHAKNVDKSGLRPSRKEIMVALRAGFPKETLKDALRAGLPIRNVVGLADAILNTWMGANRGGSFFLNDIFLILQTWQVNLFESEDVTAVLYHVLKNGENHHKARKKIPNFFGTEEEIFEHYLSMHESAGGDHE